MTRKKGFKRQKPSGSWEIFVDYGRDPKTGKRRQHTETLRVSAEEADRRIRELINRIEGEDFVRPLNITYGQWLLLWYQDYVVVNLEPRTVSSYKAEIDNHLIPKLGAIRLQNLNRRHLREYYTEALKSGRKDGAGGLGDRTVRYHHTITSESLKHAVEAGHITRNVAEAVRPPRVKRKEIITLAPAHIPRFLEVIRENQYTTSSFTPIFPPV